MDWLEKIEDKCDYVVNSKEDPIGFVNAKYKIPGMWKQITPEIENNGNHYIYFNGEYWTLYRAKKMLQLPIPFPEDNV